MDDLAIHLGAALADRYRLERELGRGGMATVYLAQDLRHHRRVALKVLHPELASAIVLDRFVREVDTAAALTHPHIVPLFDSGAIPAEPGWDRLMWYTMPYVEGESLRQRLEREGPLPLPVALRITTEVADALDYAHEHGVIHRDIKPENILLTGTHALVADFGVARALTAAGDDRLTTTGISLGTPMYMSPEQAAGARELDGRSDVYSLGCVLFEMLAGRPPWTGPTPQAAIAQRFAGPIPSVGAVRDGIPSAVDRAIETALATDPDRRFATASAFGAALSPPAAPAVAGRRAWLVRGGVALAALGAIVLGARYVSGRHGTRDSAQNRAGVHSLAVMPFVSPDRDSANAYFGAGMAEELTTAFARVPGLRVASRGSASRFQDAGAGEGEVARQLGVETILEGTVRRSGDRIRVTAQLVDPGDRTVLWAEQYDRRMAEVFEMQDDMARAIVTALVPTLADSTRRAARAARGTGDLEAYELYLKGRYYWSRRGEGGLRAAIGYYERALARDSGFARAWAGLSMSQTVLPLFSELSPDSLLALATRNAEHALALDSTLADAHLAWAYALKGEWRWRESEDQFRQALALAPDDATAHHWYGVLLWSIGRIDEAVEQVALAKRLDPLAIQILTDYGYVLYLARRYREALAEAERVWPMDTLKADGAMQIGMMNLVFGRPDSALAMFRKAERIGSGFDNRAFLSVAARRAGRTHEADSLYRALLRDEARDSSLAYAVAIAAAGAGDPDRGIRAVARAVDLRSLYITEISLACDPMLDPLKRDPGFERILSRAGMRVCPPDAETATR